MRRAMLVTIALLMMPGTAQAAFVQPGEYHEIDGSACTLNFVYDGTGAAAGRTFVGTAAHCAGKLGDDAALEDGTVFGDVAVIGDAASLESDWALIEVRPAALALVRAGVKGRPGVPTGVTAPADVSAFDPIAVSGYGIPFNLTQPTREDRTGYASGQDESTYSVIAPIFKGDSGGPIVHLPTGRALGIVSQLCLGVCTEEGPTVQAVLAQAAAKGAPVALRTA